MVWYNNSYVSLHLDYRCKSFVRPVNGTGCGLCRVSGHLFFLGWSLDMSGWCLCRSLMTACGFDRIAHLPRRNLTSNVSCFYRTCNICYQDSWEGLCAWCRWGWAVCSCGPLPPRFGVLCQPVKGCHEKRRAGTDTLNLDRARVGVRLSVWNISSYFLTCHASQASLCGL